MCLCVCVPLCVYSSYTNCRDTNKFCLTFMLLNLLFVGLVHCACSPSYYITIPLKSHWFFIILTCCRCGLLLFDSLLFLFIHYDHSNPWHRNISPNSHVLRLSGLFISRRRARRVISIHFQIDIPLPTVYYSIDPWLELLIAAFSTFTACSMLLLLNAYKYITKYNNNVNDDDGNGGRNNNIKKIEKRCNITF